MGLDPRPEGRRSEQVAIRLRLAGRIGLDPEDGARAEQHARVVAEVLPRQPPEDPDRVRQPSRTKDAQVQLSVILTDPGAEGQSIIEHRPEIGQHHSGSIALYELTIHGRPDVDGVPPENCPRRRQDVRPDPDPLLESGGRVLDHLAVDPDPGGEGEAAAVLEQPEVHLPQLPAEEGAHGAAHGERGA